MQHPAINDFEDGLEYYAAVENKCNCIITEDVNDFYLRHLMKKNECCIAKSNKLRIQHEYTLELCDAYYTFNMM